MHILLYHSFTYQLYTLRSVCHTTAERRHTDHGTSLLIRRYLLTRLRWLYCTGRFLLRSLVMLPLTSYIYSSGIFTPFRKPAVPVTASSPFLGLWHTGRNINSVNQVGKLAEIFSVIRDLYMLLYHSLTCQLYTLRSVCHATAERRHTGHGDKTFLW